MRKSDSLTGNFDWILFAVYCILTLMGVATVYSTAFNEEHPHLLDFSQKYGKQVIWVLFSLFLGLLVFLIDSDIYKKFSIPIYAFTLVLLVVVLFMPAVNGAHAWLGIGSMGIQPAEFAKIGTAILLARFLSSINLKQQNIQTVLIANGIIIIPMILILLQPDAGTFVVFTSFLFVMYREGVTYDPLLLKLVNAIPGVKFRETWVGSHFIPILFVVIFLSVATLLISNQTIELSFLPGVQIAGIYGMFFFLFLFILLGYFFMRAIFPKRQRRRALIISVIALVLATILTGTVNVLSLIHI